MLAVLSSSTVSYDGAIPLVSFDGAIPLSKFVELNDPVMGGQSSGTWSVDAVGKYGTFNGHVLDVPSLSAPGFIKAAADGTFPDASKAATGGLVLMVRSTTPSYTGFQVSFASGTLAPPYSCAGGGSIPFSRGCFKAPFSVPAGDAFTAVHVPFAAFSDKWSPATGKQTTSCAEDADVCPTAGHLKAIQRLEVWAEGADGPVHLEVQSISAGPSVAAGQPSIGAASPARASEATAAQLTAAAAAATAAAAAAAAAAVATVAAAAAAALHRPPAAYDACTAAVQPRLRYNVSSRTQPDVPVPVDERESLAEAVCCDVRARPFAEPRFLYLAPDIRLFAALTAAGVTTFYDSVCGAPLFRAPVGRTRAAFEADTTEHGWPSFRQEEVVAEHVRTNHTSGYVTSSCGTHLGTYLPDAQGARWCIDLSCVAGNPVAAVVEA